MHKEETYNFFEMYRKHYPEKLSKALLGRGYFTVKRDTSSSFEQKQDADDKESLE